MLWLRGRLGDLRLWLFGPGELLPAEPGANVQPLVQCLHTGYWGPCRRIGVGPDRWVWYATCTRCGVTARC